jgi:lipopolysaccharide biosynthesis glycosyltransferase
VINGDISTLFNTDLEGKAIGAVRDIDFLGNYNQKYSPRQKYAAEKLHLQNPYDYFQAGVLIMDLEKMREIHTVEQWLKLASDPSFIYNDQDILNMECQGNVYFLNEEWNVMHDCAGRVEGVFKFAPARFFNAYKEARKNPLIVHYAGFEKPWQNAWCDFATLYWQYARSTPFALQLATTAAGMKKPLTQEHHNRVISESSPIRKYADKLAPSGSKQREMAKIVLRKVRGI